MSLTLKTIEPHRASAFAMGRSLNWMIERIFGDYEAAVALSRYHIWITLSDRSQIRKRAYSTKSIIQMSSVTRIKGRPFEFMMQVWLGKGRFEQVVRFCHNKGDPALNHEELPASLTEKVVEAFIGQFRSPSA